MRDPGYPNLQTSMNQQVGEKTANISLPQFRLPIPAFSTPLFFPFGNKCILRPGQIQKRKVQTKQGTELDVVLELFKLKGTDSQEMINQEILLFRSSLWSSRSSRSMNHSNLENENETNVQCCLSPSQPRHMLFYRYLLSLQPSFVEVLRLMIKSLEGLKRRV